MNYQKHYNRLCKRARNRQLNCYTENHHVIPKCLGGADSSENIVVLTPEEHYVAHQLLVKMYPKHHGLVKAAIRMTDNPYNQLNTNKVYGWLRRRHSQRMKERWKNPEYREQISQRRKEQWQNPEYREKQSKQMKKRWEDPEFKKKASKARMGKKNGNYGMHWYYHPETLENKRCLPDNIPDGFIRGRKLPQLKKSNPKCIICGEITKTKKQKYCDFHRTEKRKENMKKVASDKSWFKIRYETDENFREEVNNKLSGARKSKSLKNRAE